MTMKTIRLFLLLIMAVVPMQAQRGGGLSPSPIWPGDKNGGIKAIPAEMLKTNYVYYDPTAGDLVLVYPDDLESGNQGQPKVQRRVHLNNNVAPSVAATVATNKNNPNLFDYAYTFINGPKAKDSIFQVQIVTADTTASFQAPNNWMGRVRTSRDAAIKGVGGSAVVSYMSKNAVAHAPEGAPGRSISGFGVTSGYKPGFTTAFVSNFSLVPDVPMTVVNQVQPWAQTQMNSKGVATIGPKYPAGVAQIVIVSDYLQGIKNMVEQGDLDKSSPFVQAMQTMLTNYIVTAQRVEMPASQYVAPLNLNITPTNAMETQLLAALQAATK